MPEPSDEAVATYLAGVTVTMELSHVKPTQAAVTHVLSKSSTTQLLELVAIAHRCGDAEARDALCALIKVKHEDFVADKNGALLEAIAGIAVLRCLSLGNDASKLVGLSVQSASWLGLTPALADVHTVADAAVAAAAAASRSRDGWDPISGEVMDLMLGEEEVVNAEGVVEREAVDGHAAAIERLAESLDVLGARLDERMQLVDEEYDSLWWSYTAASAYDQTPWDSVHPIGLRAVRVATELGSRISRSPAPPVVPGLIALALGDKRDKNVSLKELTRHVVELGAAPSTASHLLLPISASAALAGTFGGDEELWTKAAKTTLGVDADRSTSALDSALQLIREKQISDLL